MKIEFASLKPRTENKTLIAAASVSCGEPAEICTELEKIDLNEYLTNGQEGVYLIRAGGDSMEHEIRRDDLLIVNRNLTAQNGDTIVAFVNGDYFVKDFQPKRQGLMLVAKNEKYEPMKITAKDDFETFGVVVGILRNFKKFY